MNSLSGVWNAKINLYSYRCNPKAMNTKKTNRTCTGKFLNDINKSKI